MDVLYKYVTSERALTCIPEVGDGTLRATQPASLNDPFECAVTPVYVFRDEAEENRQLAEVLTEININNPVVTEDIDRAREQYGSGFTRQLVVEQLSTRFGIVSFSKQPRHPLLWSHYTTDESGFVTGFVIGYDSKVLSGIAASAEWLRPVKYGEKPPPIMGPNVVVSPESNLPKLLSAKSTHWCYEDEWRLIVELNKTIGTGHQDGQPMHLVQIPNEAVVSVYYTERTPQDKIELISDRLRNKNNRYRVQTPRGLVRSSTSYGYEEAPS